MPEPPATNAFIVYLLENPWPVGIVLGAGAVAGFVAVVRSGQRRWLRAAIICIIAAAGIFIIERIVVTAGEHAAQATRQLVRAAEGADVPAAMRLFSDDALMALGSPTNPGIGIDEIHDIVSLVEDRYALEGVNVTSLRAYTESRNTGIAHLRVIAWFMNMPNYPVRSSWVLRVEREDEGVWRITHITFVEYHQGTTPSMNLFR